MPHPLLKVVLLHLTQHSRSIEASYGEDTAAKAEKSDLILLAPQSDAHIITSHRDFHPIHPLIALEHENPEKTHDVKYF